MSEISAILFDKDGTVFDFRATWGVWVVRMLDDLAGGDALQADRLGRAVGFNVAAGAFLPDSPIIAGTPGEIAGALLPHLPGASPVGLIARMNASAAAATLVPAAPLGPLLGMLRDRGLRLGVATNDAEGPARAHLAAAGIAAAFEFVAGYDSGFAAKPHPGMLQAFSAHCGIAPARVAMVGDSRHDLLAARGAGMRPLAVLTGMATAAELGPLAEVVLPDIGHLPDWLQTHCRAVSAA